MGMSVNDRADFIMDTVTILRLLRRVDREILAKKDEAVYRIIRFYVETHFDLPGSITADDYIDAIVNNADIAKLVKSLLRAERMIPRDAKEEYDRLNTAVTFA